MKKKKNEIFFFIFLPISKKKASLHFGLLTGGGGVPNVRFVDFTRSTILLTLKPSIMKCKSCDEIWHDLKDGVDHFQRFFPDGGRALQQEIPVILNVLNSEDRKALGNATLTTFFVEISSFKET